MFSFFGQKIYNSSNYFLSLLKTHLITIITLRKAIALSRGKGSYESTLIFP